MANIDQTLFNIARQDEERHAKETAQKLGLPYVNLIFYPFTPKVLGIIPQTIAAENRLIAYLKVNNQVRVATDRASHGGVDLLIKNLKEKTKFDFILTFCSKTSMVFSLAKYQELLPEIKKTEIAVSEEKKGASFDQEIQTVRELKDRLSSVSTTEILDVIFAGALHLEASDIHLEPQESQMRVRFRIDGVLQDITELSMEVFHNLTSRIKYLAKMKLDVSTPQDGRYTVKVGKSDVDIRVATLPTSFGESVTLRLLPKEKQFLALENSGFSEEGLRAIKEAISKPQGLILNTGPTGSGKTTTLYAILQKLNQPGKKIITLEDPIEYRIAGIEQVQVDSDNKNSFLDGLKASLRQNPDILMIGEIRDKASADIALQAAMTGHLVLSTLHTNNAPSSFARLVEMGVEPYLLSGTINLIIAQRLVRRIHDKCAGKGCEECHQTGFKGRLAILEFIKPSQEIESLIQRKAPLREFEEMAKKLGMRTMYEDGMAKVATGLTTKEEVERVTKE